MDFDFSKNTSVDNLDSVPQDFRNLYRETDDGTFALDSDDPKVGSAVAAIMRFNGALRSSRAEVKSLKGSQVDLSPLADFGDSPAAILEKFNATIDELKKNVKNPEDLERQVDKVRAELTKAHGEELTNRDSRIKALQTQLHDRLVVSEAKSALGPVAIDVDLALPFVERMSRVSEGEDGTLSVVVVDEAGDPRYSGKTGNAMTIAELVEEMRKEKKFAPLFKSDNRSGGNLPPTGSRRPAPGRDASDMSPTEKIRAGLANRGR